MFLRLPRPSQQLGYLPLRLRLRMALCLPVVGILVQFRNAVCVVILPSQGLHPATLVLRRMYALLPLRHRLPLIGLGLLAIIVAKDWQLPLGE